MIAPFVGVWIVMMGVMLVNPARAQDLSPDLQIKCPDEWPNLTEICKNIEVQRRFNLLNSDYAAVEHGSDENLRALVAIAKKLLQQHLYACNGNFVFDGVADTPSGCVERAADVAIAGLRSPNKLMSIKASIFENMVVSVDLIKENPELAIGHELLVFARLSLSEDANGNLKGEIVDREAKAGLPAIIYSPSSSLVNFYKVVCVQCYGWWTGRPQNLEGELTFVVPEAHADD